MKTKSYAIVMILLGASVTWASELKQPDLAEVRTAADRGDAEAQYQLALAFLRGKEVSKDDRKAFELLKAAADQGHAEALGAIGYFYGVGLVVPKDEGLAVECFRKGAEKGSAKAQLNLGKFLLEGKGEAATDPENGREDGLRWIKRAADQGLPSAALAYGQMLYFGEHGLKTDYESAAPYFKIAANDGNADAQNFLGTMSSLGMGCPLDAAAAETWYRKAALQGHLKAQSNLGRTLLSPGSVAKETRIEALAWLLMASQQGEVTATKELEDQLPGFKKEEVDAAKSMTLELRKKIHKGIP